MWAALFFVNSCPKQSFVIGNVYAKQDFLALQKNMRASISILLVLLSLLATAQDGIIKVHIDGNFYSTPIVTTDGNVVIASHNKTMYLFNSRGEQQNLYTTKGWIHATPAQLSDSQIAIGSYDKRFYFFDKDGNFQKSISPKAGKIFTEPVEVGTGKIAFGTGRGKVVFYDLKADSLYFAKVGHIMHGSPLTLSNGKVAIGGNGRRVFIIDSAARVCAKHKTKGWIMHSKPIETTDGQIIVGSYDKHLYSIDSAARLNWKYKTEGRIHSSVLQTPDGNIVFGSFDKNVYCLSADGKLINKYATGNRVVSSPAMVGDSVFVICGIDGGVYFFSTKGELLGKFQADGKFFSTPVTMHDGTVFCCTMKGSLYFISREAVERIISKSADL